MKPPFRLVLIAISTMAAVIAWSDVNSVIMAQNATPTCATSLIPLTPDDLAIVRAGADVTLSWRDPSPAACRATRFYVELSRAGTDVREFETTQGNVVVTNVPPGSGWRYAVRAFNTRGLSTQRSIYQLESSAPCHEPPAPVSSVVARAQGSVVTIDWLATPSCLSSGFRISAAASPDGPELYAAQVPYPNARSWSAVAPPGTWFIRVFAEYTGGRLTAPSPWTAVVVP